MTTGTSRARRRTPESEKDGGREECRGRKVRLSRWRGRENTWNRKVEETPTVDEDEISLSFPLLLCVFVVSGGFSDLSVRGSPDLSSRESVRSS